MDWTFYAFIATVVFHFVGTPILIADLRERYPEFHKSFGGGWVFFSPFKQLDLIWWAITRQYADATGKAFHRYDLYSLNLVLIILFGIAFAVSG